MLIDCYTCLQDPELAGRVDAMIRESREGGLTRILVSGRDISDSAEAVMLARAYPEVFAAVGVHPSRAHTWNDKNYGMLKDLIQDPRTVAIGAVGVDLGLSDAPPREVQEKAFALQVKLAKEYSMPLIIHCAGSHAETLRLLREYNVIECGGMIHGFVGDRETAQSYLRMGLSVSFDSKGAANEETVRSVPLDRLLLESGTGAGRDSSPLWTAMTARSVAHAKKIPIKRVLAATMVNSSKTFPFEPNQGKNTYRIGDRIYVNLTNRCTSSCTYCIRYQTDSVHGHNLNITREPTARQVLDEIGDPTRFSEIVFCGYGEPTLRLETLKTVAQAVKEAGGKTRLNTNGHGSLIYGRDITPELAGILDSVSVSLNAESGGKYERVCRPLFGGVTYQAVVAFIREIKKHVPNVQVTAVNMKGINIEACRKMAEGMGATFKERTYGVV
jgi:TatD DNase family protein